MTTANTGTSTNDATITATAAAAAPVILRGDLDAITLVLAKAFETPAFKRDYDEVFGKIAGILYRHGLYENPRNLRFRFYSACRNFLMPSRRSSGG